MRKALLRRGALALVAVALAGSAGAAPRIAVGPLRGDRKAALARQLASALCHTYQCVPRSRVVTGGRPDLAKARRLRVAGILAGTVSREKTGRQLTLALLGRSARPQRTWSFQLTASGTLPADALSQLEDELGTELGVAPPAPPPAAPPPEAPPPPPPPSAAAEPLAAPSPAAPSPAEPAPAQPPPAEPLPPAAAVPEPEQATAPPSATPPPSAAPLVPASAKEERWLVALELGLDVQQRKLSYQGAVAGGALLGLKADAISSPRLRLELFPLSGSSGFLAGVGILGDYRTSVGLTTETPGPLVQKSSTKAWQLQAGILWRIHPAASSRLALIPGVSYVQQRYAVDPSIPGLPDADLAGVKGSIGAEIPLAEFLSFLAEGGYLKWLTARDLIKGQPPFFPGGSAWGLEAEGGFSVALFGPISLRLLFEYSLTKYSLSADPTGTYVATGASDQYLGGRAMVRGQF